MKNVNTPPLGYLELTEIYIVLWHCELQELRVLIDMLPTHLAPCPDTIEITEQEILM